MNTVFHRFFSLSPIILTLVIAAPQMTWAAAGKFEFVTGNVLVKGKDSQEFRAAKGKEINEGDTIVSGKSSFAQLLMEDGGKLSVKADTQVQIEAFQYSGREDGREHLLLTLFRGGLRAVTGEIGRTNKQNYKIRTQTATIGIRGTDHEPYYIPVPAAGEKAIGVPGTYDKVNSGAVYIETAKGQIVVLPGRTGFVAGADSAPILLMQTPDFLQPSSVKNGADDGSGASSNKSDKRSNNQGDSPYTTPNNTNKPVPLPVSGEGPRGTPVPSVTPSVIPTAIPTVTPSNVPTVAPTPTPALTPAPTAAPSVSPTASPTVIPTVAPTALPTNIPTATPTAAPTTTATSSPTTVPTPTASPTATPTATPVPTRIPTDIPAATPTPRPTATPTVTPIPTLPPAPTATPTPTAAPSPAPSPTLTPSPTAAPTPTPTLLPNSLPTPAPFGAILSKGGTAPVGAGAVVAQIVYPNADVSFSSTGVYVVGAGNGTTLKVNGNGIVKKGTVGIPDTDQSVSIGKFNKGKAGLTDVGVNADAGIYWGRWAAPGKSGNGNGNAASTPASSTHVMYSTHITNSDELAALRVAASGANANPQVVNATYNYVGGTSPSRSDGALGTVNSMSVKANFASQMITAYDLNLQFGKDSGAQVWDAHLDPAKASSASFANFTANGPSAGGGGQGIGLTGTCNSCANGSAIDGTARGLFTGNDARGLMTIFELKNGTGASVNGAAALKR